MGPESRRPERVEVTGTGSGLEPVVEGNNNGCRREVGEFR